MNTTDNQSSQAPKNTDDSATHDWLRLGLMLLLLALQRLLVAPAPVHSATTTPLVPPASSSFIQAVPSQFTAQTTEATSMLTDKQLSN